MIGSSSRLPFALLLSLRAQISDQFAVSGLAVLAVAASVALTMSVEVASRSLEVGLRASTEALVGAAALTISAGDVGVVEATLETVRAVPGVASASPLIRRTFRVAAGEGKGRALHIVGLDFLGEDDVRGYEVSRSGVVVRDAVRLLALPNSIIVSEALAREIRISDGDALALSLEGRPVNLVVRGVLGGDLAEAFGGHIAAMDIFALQQIVAMPGRFERIDAALELDASLDEVKQRVEAAVGPSLSVGSASERRGFGLALIETYRRALWAFVLIAFATSALLAYAISSMSIDRRLDELSLLRAAGMDGGAVARAVLADALVIGALGTALGATVAPLLSSAVVEVLSLASAIHQAIELERVNPSFSTMVLGLLVGVVTVVAAAVPSAQRAARIRPLDLLDLRRGAVRLRRIRFHAGLVAVVGALLLALSWIETSTPEILRVVGGVAGGVAFAAGFGLLAMDWCTEPTGVLGRYIPRVGFLIGSSLRDRPVEAALTLAAWTTISAGLIASVTIIRSYTSSIDDHYYGLYGESAVILMAGDPFGGGGAEPIAPTTLRTMRESGRVEDLAALRGVEVPVSGRLVGVTSFATEVIARRGDLAHLASDPNALRKTLESGELVLSASLAERLALRVGDHVTLPSERGPHTVRIGATTSRAAGAGAALLLDETTFDELFPDTTPTWLAALWVSPPRAESVEALRRVPTSQPHFLLEGKEARRWVARSAEKYRAMLSVPVALVSVLGIISLQGLLFGSARSREREFELLRTAGATRADVVAIVVLSGGLVGVLGALAGIGVGAAWSRVVCSFLSESFGWPIEAVHRSDIALWVLSGSAGLALIGSFLPAVLSTRPREQPATIP